MCGRYSLNLESSQSEFKPETIINNKEIFSFNNPDISPSSLSPIIFRNEKKYDFEISRWGFSFDWLPKGRCCSILSQKLLIKRALVKEFSKVKGSLFLFYLILRGKKRKRLTKRKLRYFPKKTFLIFCVFI